MLLQHSLLCAPAVLRIQDDLQVEASEHLRHGQEAQEAQIKAQEGFAAVAQALAQV